MTEELYIEALKEFIEKDSFLNKESLMQEEPNIKDSDLYTNLASKTLALTYEFILSERIKLEKDDDLLIDDAEKKYWVFVKEGDYDRDRFISRKRYPDGAPELKRKEYKNRLTTILVLHENSSNTKKTDQTDELLYKVLCETYGFIQQLLIKMDTAKLYKLLVPGRLLYVKRSEYSGGKRF